MLHIQIELLLSQNRFLHNRNNLPNAGKQVDQNHITHYENFHENGHQERRRTERKNNKQPTDHQSRLTKIIYNFSTCKLIEPYVLKAFLLLAVLERDFMANEIISYTWIVY